MLFERGARSFLPDNDYLPIAMPNTGLHALQVLTRQGGVLRRYSELDTILHVPDGTSAPDVNPETVVGASGKTCRVSKIGLGLSLLAAIVKALGGDELGLDGSAGNARSVEYSYTNVTADAVDLGSLDIWLAVADFDPRSDRIGELLASEQLYAVVGVLKAQGVSLALLDSGDQKLDLHVPTIAHAVGANIDLDRSKSVQTTLELKGSIPISIAAKAAQIKLDETGGFWVDSRPVTKGEVRDLNPGASFLTDPSGTLSLV